MSPPPGPGPLRAAGWHPWWTLIGLLTVAAFVLRLPGLGQAIALDETLTFDEIHGHSLWDVIPQMRAHGEDNPPLYYLLAWLGSLTGDDTVTIRLPSLILGALSVPLVYLLGARTVGRAPGALAAAFAAVSPFGLFYAAEARAYATTTFFSVLSTLLLLRALETRSRWWWAGYAAGATALMYSHYTAGLLLAAQGAWALLACRSQWRAIVLSGGAALVAFIPWAATAEGGNFETVVGGPLHPELSSFEALLAVFPGQPYSQILRPALEDFPGLPALVLLGAGMLIGLVAGLAARRPAVEPGDTDGPPPRLPLLLLAALAFSTPAGVFAYAVIKHDIFLSRYFSASLPGALVLVAWLLLRPRGALRVAAVALASAGLLVGTLKAFEARFARPAIDDMAAYIRARTDRGDPVVENPLPKLAFLSEPLHAYLGGTRDFANDPRADSAVWRSPHVAIVTADLGILPFAPRRWGPGLCFRRFAHRGFEGVVDEGVAIYSLGAGGAGCMRSLPTFGKGFGAHEEDLAHQWRALLEPTGRIVLRNRGGEPARVRVTFSVDRPGGPPAPVTIGFPDATSAKLTATGRPAPLARTVRLRPGPNVIAVSAGGDPAPSAFGPPSYLRLLDLRVVPER